LQLKILEFEAPQDWQIPSTVVITWIDVGFEKGWAVIVFPEQALALSLSTCILSSSLFASIRLRWERMWENRQA
jgi:hypothetical protein